MAKTKALYAQGDVILRPVGSAKSSGSVVALDPDGALVLARGEVTGHRHAFYGSPHVAMFRDDALARSPIADIYIGTLKIEGEGAKLRHEEHGTIAIEPGTYVVTRQREYPAREGRRQVED